VDDKRTAVDGFQVNRHQFVQKATYRVSTKCLITSRLFAHYVRPLLEFSTPVWSPHYQYLILKIEIVQRAYTKRLTGMKNLYYLDRLEALGIFSLERRRLEHDLILCYSLFHGICEIYLPFKLGVSVTRGNSCKLIKTSCNTNAAKYFYTNRIVRYLHGTV